jgi:hypothetical protein
MQRLDRNLKPDKRLAAVCGLVCPCSYVRLHGDEVLRSIAK